MRFALAIILVSLCPFAARAADTPPWACDTAILEARPPQTPAAAGAADSDDWPDVLGQRVPAFMEDHAVPGLAIAIVDGDVAMACGYGFANGETGLRAAADTPFYLASTAKLFTAMAILDLVWRQELSLDADINRFLDGWAVDDAGYGPLTLRQLLTHSAGFDDRNIGYAARDLAQREPLSAHIRRRLPPRPVAPPSQ